MASNELIYGGWNVYWCMFSNVSPVSPCVDIDDRRAIFIRFSPLKDTSAEQLVTGRLHKILTSALIFGYIEVVRLRVVVGVDGKLSRPCSFRYCCHLICQQSNSLLMQSGDGRSSRYIHGGKITHLGNALI